MWGHSSVPSHFKLSCTFCLFGLLTGNGLGHFRAAFLVYSWAFSMVGTRSYTPAKWCAPFVKWSIRWSNLFINDRTVRPLAKRRASFDTDCTIVRTRPPLWSRRTRYMLASSFQWSCTLWWRHCSSYGAVQRGPFLDVLFLPRHFSLYVRCDTVISSMSNKERNKMILTVLKPTVAHLA